MTLESLITEKVKQAIKTLYNQEINTVELQPTRKEFEGDITVVTFPFLRFVKGRPEAVGEAVGAYLIKEVAEIKSYNVIKGFLNLEVSDAYYLSFFEGVRQNPRYGFEPEGSKGAVMVEFSSPNTNKPLHLGHIRNNLLGDRKSVV